MIGRLELIEAAEHADLATAIRQVVRDSLGSPPGAPSKRRKRPAQKQGD